MQLYHADHYDQFDYSDRASIKQQKMHHHKISHFRFRIRCVREIHKHAFVVTKESLPAHKKVCIFPHVEKNITGCIMQEPNLGVAGDTYGDFIKCEQ
jgi:hypothetical protein